MTEVRKSPSPIVKLWTNFWADPALSLAVLVLLAVSGFATWRGLTDFITQRGSDTSVLVVITAMVIGLTLAMFVALREMVRPRAFFAWLFSAVLYIILALWSVGFGYGFWWSLFAGPTATENSLKQAVAGIEQEVSGLRADVSAAAALMTSAASLSDQKAATEETRGGTCGVASAPGDGPLARARRETQAEIAALASAVSENWLTPIDAELATLDEPMRTILAVEIAPEDRKVVFERVYTEVTRAGRNIAADAEARAAGFASQLRAKANRLNAAPGDPAFYCYDPDLASSLRAAANAMSKNRYAITPPPFEFSDGTAGVARAVERLWMAAASPFLRETDAPGQVFTGTSLIALIAAAAVDLALFVFAWLQRAKEAALEKPVKPKRQRRNKPHKKQGEISQKTAEKSVAALPRERVQVSLPQTPATFWDALGTFDPPDIDIDPDSPKHFKDLPQTFQSRFNKLNEDFEACQVRFDDPAEDRDREVREALGALDKMRAMEPPIYPFGAIGDRANNTDYEIADEVISEGHQPGDIVDIRRAGFRINDRLIVQKAVVVIAAAKDTA